MSDDQDGLNVPLSLIRLQTNFFPDCRPLASFSQSIYFRKHAIVHFFPVALRYKSSLSLLPVIQRIVFSKDLEAIRLKCNHLERQWFCLPVSVGGQKPNFLKYQLANTEDLITLTNLCPKVLQQFPASSFLAQTFPCLLFSQS